MHWNASTAQAARKPKMERTVESVSEPPSSSSSPWNVAICVAETEPVERGCVGGANCTVAFGNATVFAGFGAPGAVAGPARLVIGAVFKATVGAPLPGVFSLMVGAGAGRAVGGPAVLRGMVGAGAGGAPGADGAGTLGAGTVATGGGAGALTVGVGGLGITGAVGGATGAGATGASLALSVTRTVSFFKGMLAVCLDGVVFFSSLMDTGLMVCAFEET